MSISKRFVAGISQPFDFALRVPASKSIVLRQLAISALCSKPTTLCGFTHNDDVDAMTTALSTLKVRITTAESGRVEINPTNLDLTSDIDVDLQMSGVSLRTVCAIAGLRSGSTTIVGNPSLAARPNDDLLAALSDLGCKVESNDGKLPIRIQGPITAKEVSLRTDVSSQFLSALLLIAPYLPRGLTVHLTGELPSKSYVQLTLDELRKRGVCAPKLAKSIHIPPTSIDDGTFNLEGDASAMTYHAALATIHASRVEILNLGRSSKQGDMQFLGLCSDLGANVSFTEQSVIIQGPENLHPIDTVDMYDFPDSATTLMAIAPFLPKSIRINGLDTLPRKECDRIACPAEELRKAGIDVEYGSNFMKINPGSPKQSSFSTYDDHRMAMSFAVLATKTEGCWIEDPDCVGKTYPQFWSDVNLAYS